MPLLLKTSFWLSTMAVVVLSLLPVAYLPPQSFDIWDKTQHAAGFLALALLGLAAYPATPALRLSLCRELITHDGAVIATFDMPVREGADLRPHLVQNHGHAHFGRLPGGLGPGHAAADDMK